MSNWKEYLEQDQPHHSGRKINKEKFCKRNKLDHGRYGYHIYENGHCKLCNKIDPKIKHKRLESEVYNGTNS